jgi:SAM-dependent methyltransferase
MRRLNEHGFSHEDNILITLAACQYWLDHGDKVLDFGCGGGATVCELRERGYSAFGFEIKDYLSQEAKAHKEWFSFRDNDTSDQTDYIIDENAYRLPYENDVFDLILSSTTLEHISNLDHVALELSRITRPGGVNLHIFPPKLCLVEPHTLVAFATYKFFQRFSWFYLMGLLRIRNECQKKWTAREMAQRNLIYCQQALFFRDDDEIQNIFSRHFNTTYYVDKFYYSTNARRPDNAWEYLKAFAQKGELLPKLARAPMMKVLLTVK